MDFELIFYKKPNGDCPVMEFLDSLNKVMRFKMMQKLFSVGHCSAYSKSL